ncbi:MAG: dihydroneopterin aldolase [Deltaproteobacteria bacterium]|nr:dihydroneopterin aldolase [Deltaproteobacteria bacterium]
MTDKIIIQGLKTQCVIGDYEWERKRPQAVILNLELECDCKPAGLKDALEAGMVDYSQVTEKVLGFIETSSFHLIEALAEQVAHLCLNNFDIQGIRLRLSKPAALRATETVSVEIYRRKQ